MRVFVYSFGTIELVDGIVIVDANINYKTFEKEYVEILAHRDKIIKKLLKNAFEKGEYAIKDPKLEKILLDILEKLEKYDKPSFAFIESFQTSNKKSQKDKLIDINGIEPSLLDEPELFEEPPVIESAPRSDKLRLKDEPKSLGAADLQDTLSTIDLKEISEKSAFIKDVTEEIPISGIGTQAEEIASNFLIQMVEEAKFKLNHDNKIKKAEINGKIKLKNAGNQDRIWDINLKLDKIKSTSLEQKLFHINELGPGETWEKEYNVKKQKILPILFNERIDTFAKNPEENHTLILKQKTNVEFTFYLENQNNHKLFNLKLEKRIPKVFTDLKLIDKIPNKTKLEVQDHVIIWKISNLKPKQKLTLKIQAKILPNNLESIKTGPIQISFTKLNDFYSDIVLEDVSGISKNMYYIEKDETEKQSDQWNCRFVLENKSEFPYLLENAEIFSGDIESEQKVTVFQAINEIIEPTDDRWISKEWTVISEEIPTFGKKIKFKIIPNTMKSFLATISIDETQLPILWAEVKKIYSLTEIASYVNTTIEVKNTIINKSDAEINEFNIKDFIPENFIPPSLDIIKFFLDERELDFKQQKIDLQIKLEPDSNDSSEPHQLSIQLLNLQDSIGAIKKDSKLEIQYSTTAINPPPTKIYSFLITIICNTIPVGAPLEISSDMIENPEIKVTHWRRRLTIGKSVSPGTASGEYEIEIMYKNRGNTPIEHALISDLVPENFQMLFSEPEATINKIENKTILEWKFDIIEPGKKIEISYKIKGTGEYKTGDAEIFYKV